MRVRTDTSEKGIIAWFASNHVAANLMMWFIIVAGLISVVTIRKQTTPEIDLNLIQVQVPYLGAAPQEVEEGVVIKIEEAIQDIPGIVEINSRAFEGSGNVTIEVATGEDINEILTEVKTRVDAISTFPGLTEKPIIYKQEVPIHVVFLTVTGDLNEYARKEIGLEIRDELMRIPSVNQVQILGDRDYEISIEVSEHVLRQYGGVTAAIALAELYGERHGQEEAAEFLRAQIAERPTVRGVQRLTELEREEPAADNNGVGSAVLHELTAQLMAEHPAYKCGRCGFPARALHWQCPGCKQWNSIKPVRGVQGE